MLNPVLKSSYPTGEGKELNFVSSPVIFVNKPCLFQCSVQIGEYDWSTVTCVKSVTPRMLSSHHYFFNRPTGTITLDTSSLLRPNSSLSVSPDNIVYTHLNEGSQVLSGVSPSQQIDTELGALMKYYCFCCYMSL